MTRGTRVRITKVGPVADPAHPTAAPDEWLAGRPNPQKAPPGGYWIEGELLDDVAEGAPVRVARDVRGLEGDGGVRTPGYFQSSPITSVGTPVRGHAGDGLFTTANSIYRVEDLGLEVDLSGDEVDGATADLARALTDIPGPRLS